MTVAESGLMVGFSSHSAFCKAFKSKTGISPGDWKKENKLTG